MYFNCNNVNPLNVKVGDVVEFIRFKEYEGNVEYCDKLKGVVEEIGRRWFRVYVKCRLGGYFTCVHFVDTYKGGKKMCYRVVE